MAGTENQCFQLRNSVDGTRATVHSCNDLKKSIDPFSAAAAAASVTVVVVVVAVPFQALQLLDIVIQSSQLGSVPPVRDN